MLSLCCLLYCEWLFTYLVILTMASTSTSDVVGTGKNICRFDTRDKSDTTYRTWDKLTELNKALKQSYAN